MYLESSSDFSAAPSQPSTLHKFAGAVASCLAVICFALGVIGSAFDEASAADMLLPVGVPHVASWNWALDHVAWFAAANLVAGLGILMLSGWVASRRKARVPSFRRSGDFD